MRLLALVPLIVCSLAWGQGNPLQVGLELFHQEKYEAALQQFENARRLRPADAVLANLIGITETKLGRIDAANQDYEAASHLDPMLPGPRKNLGFNYLGQGKYDLAEPQLKAALDLDNADPFVHYYLAILYLSTARDKDAIAHIKPAQTLLENDPATAVMAVFACLRLNCAATGLELIKVLEQRSSLSIQQEYQIAKLLNDQRMYAESAERFERIVELEPQSWQNKYNLALALLRAKQTKRAIPLLTAVAADHATDANLLATIASAYDSAGESQLAIDAYQKAIAADPTNPDRYLDCTRLLIDLDRYNDAREIIEHGIPLVPDDYPLTIRLGAIEAMRGNRAQAREIYQKAIAEHPALALGYAAVAQTYMKEGNDQEALQVVTDARTKVPRDFALEYIFGLISFHLGHLKEATEALQSAEELGPSVAEPHFQLGLLYMKTQQWKGAQEELEQVIKLDPHNAAGFYQLSRTYQRLGDSTKAQEMAKVAGSLMKTQREDAMKLQELRFGIPVQN